MALFKPTKSTKRTDTKLKIKRCFIKVHTFNIRNSQWCCHCNSTKKKLTQLLTKRSFEPINDLLDTIQYFNSNADHEQST